MAYLIPQDFVKSIQKLNLQQVIGSDYTIINSWLLAAQEKIRSKLVQKYLIDAELTNTTKWDGTKAYEAGDRVYLDAPEYQANESYAVGDYTVEYGNFYQATAISTSIPFTAANWTLINSQYTIYYATYPATPFNVYSKYNRGDSVYWMGKVYIAQQSTQVPNDNYVLQYGSYNNIPLPNYFPGSPDQGQWNSGTSYIVPANTPITDAKWTNGDNRCQQILQIAINFVLYYAHARISPMNVPNHIRDSYAESKGVLQEFCDGLSTPNLIKIQPKAGNRIRFGGDIRTNNQY